MGDMLLWFSVVLILFAVGDLIANLTKAKISAVFVTLLLFLILFVTKVIPSDIIDRAGMTDAASWSVPMIMFSMGTMLNIRQFIDEWRTVLTAWLGIAAVIILVIGVIVTALGIVPKDILEKGKLKGFINMVVFAAVIPSLASISLTDLISLIVPVVAMFAVSIVAVFIMMKILPGWKIIGSKPLAFGVGFCQMLGFPTTYLISNEVCNAVGETEEERAYLMSKIMPKLVVGGLACLVSVLIAGVMAPML